MTWLVHGISGIAWHVSWHYMADIGPTCHQSPFYPTCSLTCVQQNQIEASTTGQWYCLGGAGIGDVAPGDLEFLAKLLKQPGTAPPALQRRTPQQQDPEPVRNQHP